MTRSRTILLAAAGCVGAAFLCFSIWQFYKLQFWRGPDAQFGDQHLKTTVALIELHKVRYGRYPAELSDLRFLGAWDPIATGSVAYHVNAGGTRYCVEVQRGWVGRPHLNMPAEFWQGTGYESSLCR